MTPNGTTITATAAATRRGTRGLAGADRDIAGDLPSCGEPPGGMGARAGGGSRPTWMIALEGGSASMGIVTATSINCSRMRHPAECVRALRLTHGLVHLEGVDMRRATGGRRAHADGVQPGAQRGHDRPGLPVVPRRGPVERQVAGHGYAV